MKREVASVTIFTGVDKIKFQVGYPIMIKVNGREEAIFITKISLNNNGASLYGIINGKTRVLKTITDVPMTITYSFNSFEEGKSNEESSN